MTDSDAEHRGFDNEATVTEQEPTEATRDTLASQRRQVALEHLLRKDRPPTATELARRIAVSETDLRSADLPESLIQQIYLELTRVHVPALDTIGFLEYDSESGRVRLDAKPATVQRHLDAVQDRTEKPDP